MKTLEFKTTIKAAKEKVWFVLWDNITYGKWTTPFSEGSYAITDWKEGSIVHFLSPSGGGMCSKITERVDNEKMCFIHISEIKNFEEQPLTDETKLWSGASESYYLTESNGETTLTVKMDMMENHFDFFNNAFPNALTIVKELAENFKITVAVSVDAPIEKVWECWTDPIHIIKWNFASDDWFSPNALNDLKVGGKFNYRMEAKDGSFGFDYYGFYTKIKQHELIELTLGEELEANRMVTINFYSADNKTIVTESFIPEDENGYDLQKGGWQMIMNNFKKHVERV